MSPLGLAPAAPEARRQRERVALRASRNTTAVHDDLVLEKLGLRWRQPELDRLADRLDADETVVTMATALFRSARVQGLGVAVLTDRRLLCIDRNAALVNPLEFPLAEMSLVTLADSQGVGGSKRGGIKIVCAGLPTELLRIDPWERAAEIVAYIERHIGAATAQALEDSAVEFEHWAGTRWPVRSEHSSAELVLASDSQAPGEARRTVRLLGRDRAADCVAAAELVISEVVTNAVRHSAGDGVSISFWSDADVLDVLVSDGGQGFSPRPRMLGADRLGGRGLGLIDSLVESWGASACSPSAVWFRSAMTSEHPAREIDAGDERDSAADERDSRAEERDSAAQVRDDAALTREQGTGLSPAQHSRTARDRADAVRDRNEGSKDRRLAASDRERAAVDRAHAGIDALTGALERGRGLVDLQREMHRARRTGEGLVIAFVDVDGLKAVNDGHGHAAGDRVLSDVANALRGGLRSYDLVIRYGGDEFLCVLPGSNIDGARRRFDDVARSLARRTPRVAATIGLAAHERRETPDELIARADAALYSTREIDRAGA